MSCFLPLGREHNLNVEMLAMHGSSLRHHLAQFFSSSFHIVLLLIDLANLHFFHVEQLGLLDICITTDVLHFEMQYARQHLLDFMFRHGHYKDACLLFFPPNSVPPPPQPSSGVVTSSSSPQRQDPLATDYGTLDLLCDLCTAYGAMPVLEEVLSGRTSNITSQDPSVNKHTTAALSRICNYCETHKHFNYLYKFQVLFTIFSFELFHLEK